ncbi:MAG TPA: hypothetical protein PKV56_02605 [Burkholderiaceae bacterium]|nr:hypothetical protein [Burkholderiaceae bacterium]
MHRRHFLSIGLLGGCAAAAEDPVAPREARLLSPWRTVDGGFLAQPSLLAGLPPRPGAGMYVRLMASGALALRGNDLLVADMGTARLWRADVMLNTLTAIAGAPVFPNTAVALGPDLSAWVLDTASRQVLRFGRDGRLLQTLRAGSATAMALADSGNTVLVAESALSQWSELRAVGSRAVPVRPEIEGSERVIGVDGLALARNGLFVLDRAEAVVHRVGREGRVLATLGAGELAQPSAIAADRSDRVFVVDEMQRVLRLLQDGQPAVTIDAEELGVQRIGGVAVDERLLAVSDSLTGRVVIHQLAAAATSR